ncbi:MULTISPECIES: YcxB family protein [Microbulbifer]|uniref:YcxB family protein n=2 Tax=Microbulbiferaceae TaxID=1706373 RepID=UPI001E358610|nr:MULTISPECIES: YcxB family protein [Microbulbifer]UHQ53848.1 YcxB family protein [Microbulbifer sp. YPW16]
MEQVFRYQREDWEKFQSFLEKDLCRSTKMWHERPWFNVTLWFIIALVFLTFFQDGSEFSWPTAGIVGFFFILIFTQVILAGLKLKKLCAPSEEGMFIGEHRFKFDEEGIHSQGKGYSATHNWSVVKRAVKTDGAIYLFLDNAYAYIFPLSQLEDPGKFYDYVDSKINATSLSS